MKFVAYAAAIAMLTATAAYAESGSMTGTTTTTTDSHNGAAMEKTAPANPEAMPSKAMSDQAKKDPTIGKEQSAQMPAAACNAADSTCGDARGNPAVKSPTQKKVVPASPQ